MSQYSFRLGGGDTAAGGNLTLYTVPSGSFAIVRCIDMVANASGAFGPIQVRINGVAFLFSGNTTTTVQYLQWTGRQVMNAGEQLVASSIGVGCYFLASGYVFPL